MASGVGGVAGGIVGLCGLLADPDIAEAIEFDLIALGLRLRWVGTGRLTWRDLAVIVRRSPVGSALAVERHGEEAMWTLTDHLLALTVDVLQVANWQRAGNKHSPRPKPIPRPGVKEQGRKFGRDPIPIRDFEAWWSAAS